MLWRKKEGKIELDRLKDRYTKRDRQKDAWWREREKKRERDRGRVLMVLIKSKIRTKTEKLTIMHVG